MASDRWMQAMMAVLEPVAALIGAAALTLLLTAPFIPTGQAVELSLGRAIGDPSGDLVELAARIESLGLASRVEVVDDSVEPRLILQLDAA